MNPRAPIFASLKDALGGRPLTPAEVFDFDKALDRCGVPREAHEPGEARRK